MPRVNVRSVLIMDASRQVEAFLLATRERAVRHNTTTFPCCGAFSQQCCDAGAEQKHRGRLRDHCGIRNRPLSNQVEIEIKSAVASDGAAILHERSPIETPPSA